MATASTEASAQAQPLTARTLFCTLSRPLAESYLQLRYRQRLLDLSETHLRTLGHLAAWQYVAADTDAQDLDLRRKLRQLKIEAVKAVAGDRGALQEARRAFESLLEQASVEPGAIKLLDGLDWFELLKELAVGEDSWATCPGSGPGVMAVGSPVVEADRDREEIRALVEHIAGLASQRDRLQRRFSARDPVLWKLLNVEVNIYINARPLADARYRLLLAGLDRSRGAEPLPPVVATHRVASASPRDGRDDVSSQLS